MNAIKKFIKKYKQPIRAFLGWFGGIMVQVVAVGPDTMMTWDKKRWALGLFAAAIPGIVGLMRGGENNPTDEELYEKVRAVKKARAAEGVEVTDPGTPLPKP